VEELMRAAFGPNHCVRPQMPLVLGLSTDPVPDIAVVPGTPRDYAAIQPRTALLMVEIAESSLGYDTREKSSLYAAAGITDYWVLDLPHRALHVFRDPAQDPSQMFGGIYRSRARLDVSDSVSPLAAPAAKIAARDMLP
ncbi:MAG TPA: Uma2 family endonuclease, partial [Pirellulales bacterium]